MMGLIIILLSFFCISYSIRSRLTWVDKNRTLGAL